jgi:hypothetical protein
LDIVKFLFEQNDYLVDFYNEGLILACDNGHLEVVKFIIEHDVYNWLIEPNILMLMAEK